MIARIREDWVRHQFYDYTSASLAHAQDLDGKYLSRRPRGVAEADETLSA